MTTKKTTARDAARPQRPGADDAATRSRRRPREARSAAPPSATRRSATRRERAAAEPRSSRRCAEREPSRAPQRRGLAERRASALSTADSKRSQAQIRKLEAQLDAHDPAEARCRRRRPRRSAERAARAIAGAAHVRDALERPGVPTTPESVFDTARELLSSDFYLRQWGRLAMRNRSEEVDEFGFDPDVRARAAARSSTSSTSTTSASRPTGIEHVPSEGRCLLVANHSGTLPLDGVMLKTAVRHEPSGQRDLRWLAEDFIYPPAVPRLVHEPASAPCAPARRTPSACSQGAARRRVSRGREGIGKLYRERYRLQRFGRGGFIKLVPPHRHADRPVRRRSAPRRRTRCSSASSTSRTPRRPVRAGHPDVPALGPLGLVPAPTKWQIDVRRADRFDGYGPEAADDELLVGRLAERVRATIQGMLDRAFGRGRASGSAEPRPAR